MPPIPVRAIPLLLCLLPLPALSQSPPPAVTPQQATARQPTPLLQQPAADAPVLTQLNKAEPLQVLLRQGGWYQVEPAAKPAGWVRLFAVQFAKTIYRPDNQPLADLQGLVLPGHQQVTSTTGVRGLDKVAIEQARADFTALQKVQSFQQSKAQAEAFAAQATLQPEPALPLKEVQP